MTETKPTKVVTPPPPAGARRIDSAELLQNAGRLIIDHEGTRYVLSRTRQGKLILTK
ncbi:MAG: hypothetical protein RLZ44_1513 [Pseudomonadota bacterium]|jgi:hemin uptake protein HemP